MIMGIGFLLIVSLVVNAALAALGEMVERRSSAVGPRWRRTSTLCF